MNKQALSPDFNSLFRGALAGGLSMAGLRATNKLFDYLTDNIVPKKGYDPSKEEIRIDTSRYADEGGSGEEEPEESVAGEFGVEKQNALRDEVLEKLAGTTISGDVYEIPSGASVPIQEEVKETVRKILRDNYNANQALKRLPSGTVKLRPQDLSAAHSGGVEILKKYNIPGAIGLKIPENELIRLGRGDLLRPSQIAKRKLFTDPIVSGKQIGSKALTAVAKNPWTALLSALGLATAGIGTNEYLKHVDRQAAAQALKDKISPPPVITKKDIVNERPAGTGFYWAAGLPIGAYLTHYLMKRLEKIKQDKEFASEVGNIEEEIGQQRQKKMRKTSAANPNFSKEETVRQYLKGFTLAMRKEAGILDSVGDAIGSGANMVAETPGYLYDFIRLYPELLGVLAPTGFLAGQHLTQLYYPEEKDTNMPNVVFTSKKKKKMKKAGMDTSTASQMLGAGYLLDLIRRDMGDDYLQKFLQEQYGAAPEDFKTDQPPKKKKTGLTELIESVPTGGQSSGVGSRE